MITESELSALKFLSENGGCVLITAIPDKNEKGLFGDIEPGISVYLKLEKRGLLYVTEEEPDENGFTFTEMVYLTEAGEQHSRRIDPDFRFLK